MNPKNNHTANMPRRNFIKASLASAALTTTSYNRIFGANERVGMGFIGFGLIGKPHVIDFKELPDVDMVGISDAHSGRRQEALDLIGGSAKAYPDFRNLIENPDVDAVCIATPDHWHALMTMMPCAAGKDVYVEKPLNLFVREGRWMIDVAQRHKRVVQVGTQQRSGKIYHEAKQFIQNGKLGDPVLVRITMIRNLMPGLGHPPNQDPPKELDWEMFTGPAPMRPYNPHRGIYNFRWYWDYSGGQLTNWGTHSLDIAHWILNPPGPTSVYSVGGRRYLDDNCDVPDTQEGILEYPGWNLTFTVRECSNGRDNGNLGFYGTKGSLFINRGGYTVTSDRRRHPNNIFPLGDENPIGGPQPPEHEEDHPEYWTEEIRDRSGDGRKMLKLHVRNFIDSIKTRQQPNSDLESGHRIASAIHLSNISLRLGGRRLEWDAAKEEITNDPEANQMLERPYRSPWDKELKALL